VHIIVQLKISFSHQLVKFENSLNPGRVQAGDCKKSGCRLGHITKATTALASLLRAAMFPLIYRIQ
jgi:hypothetical protein